MKRILPFSLIVLAAIVLSACGGAAPTLRSGENFELAPAAPMPVMDMGYAEEGVAQSPGSGGGVQAASAEQMIIENAEITVVVSDVETRMAELQEMARGMGGYVVSSNLYKTYRNNIEAPEGTLVIRVPSGNLKDALATIKAGAVEVQNETSSAQDVTSQYVDLQSRLKNLEAAERQLTEIMKDATETEDVVNIFNQLVYYREQIELVKGQMKYLEESAALSAINIRLVAEATIRPLEIGGWKPQGIARDAIQDLIYFWQNFVNFLIRFVIYTLPVWITVGVPLYLVFIGVRALFRKLRGNKAKVEEQVVEKKAEKK
ncbi:MAG TPA: DUF4349 domain-containing protein [Anaerolineales bacterium]|nr:DUF4349 domain-containing protein [Anaerolineales bacterium]